MATQTSEYPCHSPPFIIIFLCYIISLFQYILKTTIYLSVGGLRRIIVILGRDPETSQMNLEKAGVQLDQQTKKIIANDKEQTSVPHIFAIGDVVQVRTTYVVKLEKTCERCLC